MNGAFVVSLLQVLYLTPEQPEYLCIIISAVVRNFLVSFISLSLWTCIATSPLARLSLRSSPPERHRADLARQTLALEAFHIRTWQVRDLWLPFRLFQYNPGIRSRFLFSWL